MNHAKAKKLLSTNTFKRVVFTKRGNGETRRMLCRGGVKKGLTGAGPKYDADSKGLVTVYEVGVGWKNVPADAITEIRAGGKVYKG